MGSNCDNIRILLKQMKSSDKVLGSKKSNSVMEVIYVIPNLSKIWKKVVETSFMAYLIYVWITTFCVN